MVPRDNDKEMRYAIATRIKYQRRVRERKKKDRIESAWSPHIGPRCLHYDDRNVKNENRE